MTKRDIAKAISGQAGVTAAQALEIVQGVLDCIRDTLATGGRVELRNSGVFAVKKREARKARNRHTGGSVAVPEKPLSSSSQSRRYKRGSPGPQVGGRDDP